MSHTQDVTQLDVEHAERDFDRALQHGTPQELLQALNKLEAALERRLTALKRNRRDVEERAHSLEANS